jgi:hypothetical protein
MKEFPKCGCRKTPLPLGEGGERSEPGEGLQFVRQTMRPHLRPATESRVPRLPEGEGEFRRARLVLPGPA